MAKTTPTTVAANATASKKPRAPRTKKSDTLQLNMLQSADDSLNQLLAELGAPEAADEVVEPAFKGAEIEVIAAEETLPDDVLAALAEVDEFASLDEITEAAPAAAAAIEPVVAAEIEFAAPVVAEPEPEDDPLAALIADADDATFEAAPVAEEGGEAEEGAEEGAAPAKVKREAKPRKFYSDQTERLRDNLGDNLQGYMVLTAADADLDEEALKKCMSDTLALIKDMNKKEQKWAAKFIEFLAGKKSSLSEVTHRMLKVLERDGHISMGTEGNAYKDLLAKPYSPGAARAMGGNNLGMLKDLKVVVADGAKGRYIANPDSLLLAKAKSMLSTSTPAAA